MNEKLNIETCTTAAESPFNNGTMECHNLIVAKAMEKIEGEKCEQEIALIRAVSAKNSLQNHLRHSPNELVFDFNISTPSVLTDQLTA